MKDHASIDRRGLDLARAIVTKLESGDLQGGLAKARAVNRRWREQGSSPLHEEWKEILQGNWTEIKAILLDESEGGNRLRQNSPFCGILTPHERWAIFREHRRHAA
ncbi:MAG TPA: hypothetical protein PKE55_08465 [Kiritimatiellia bacterium]|nr:hypothetical protein [Kiritimatiellia bacterium]